MATTPKKGRRGELIFTPRIRLRNGRVLYASQFGKKVFAIWVKKKRRAA